MTHEIICGDMRIAVPMLEPGFDSCVTDPPYELNFMGKRWDRSGVSFQVGTWRAVYDALKPGAHLLAFGGPRTAHRMACAIEDAGFEIRDEVDYWYDADAAFAAFYDSLSAGQRGALHACAGSPHLSWLYGQGFPKSLDVSKAIDKAAGAERETLGPRHYADGTMGHWGGGATYADDEHTRRLKAERAAKLDTAPATPAAAQWQGWGTALKPAHEPIVVARKPLSESTVAANVLTHGTGALNIDGCRVGEGGQLKWATPRGMGSERSFADDAWTQAQGRPHAEATVSQVGRWPANVILDEEAGRLLDGQSGERRSSGGGGNRSGGDSMFSGVGRDGGRSEQYADSGGASRFFYCPKANAEERRGGSHPTVKPVALTRYLVRLVTPNGGRVLDPFAGTFKTGEACVFEGFDFTGIDLEEANCETGRLRLALARGEDVVLPGGPTRRPIKTPLFGEV